MNHTSIYLIYNFTYYFDNNRDDFVIHGFSFLEQEANLRDPKSLSKVGVITTTYMACYSLMIRSAIRS